MKKIIIWGLCIIFVGALSLSAAYAKDIEVASKITAIDVSGNKQIPTQDILPAVFSKVNDTIDQEKIKIDLKSIYALGYFSDVTVSFEAYKDGSKIIFNVKENHTLKSVYIQGNTVYSTSEMTNALGLTAGQVF